ncbi:MAG: NUDIX domain-containing protein [Bacteroidales bacterium]|nr:NUDIX domain-containing protein [Bacteroidales bacterium]
MKKKNYSNIGYDKNFPVKVDGKTFWISRGVATVAFVIKRKNGKLWLLIEKRGKGAADNVGKYCVPCGYLEPNVTCEENMAKELVEECGFIADETKLKFIKLNSSPMENNQNVSVHYLYEANEDEDFDLSKAVGGEPDEVEEVKWYPIGKLSDDGHTVKVDIYGITADNWAFDHEKRVIEYLSLYYNLEYDD